MKRVRYVFGSTYLTPCEADYVGLIVMGFNHRQIGEKLGKELSTVNTVRDKLYGKMGISSRAILVGVALRNGFNEDGNHGLKALEEEEE